MQRRPGIFPRAATPRPETQTKGNRFHINFPPAAINLCGRSKLLWPFLSKKSR